MISKLVTMSKIVGNFIAVCVIGYILLIIGVITMGICLYLTAKFAEILGYL